MRTGLRGQHAAWGFFAFLRSGEFMVQSSESYDPSWHLPVQDVAVDSTDNRSVLHVHIKGSKLISGVRVFTSWWKE